MNSDLIPKLLKKGKPLHFTLIDPDKQEPEEAGKIARIAESYGTDAIMIGGSTVKGKEIVDRTVAQIKSSVDIPTILFPNSHESLSEYADYLFFMTLLNSKNYRFFAGEQVKGAPLISDFNLKPISMAYIVVSTSSDPTQVEKVADLDIIKSDEIDKAKNYARTGEHFGFSCIYLEAGSGAELPVPNEMIKEVKKVISVPLIVGGGIRDAKTAREKIDSGADIIVTGTICEEDCSKLEEIIKEIKS